jgi:hypothetical protein
MDGQRFADLRTFERFLIGLPLPHLFYVAPAATPFSAKRVVGTRGHDLRGPHEGGSWPWGHSTNTRCACPFASPDQIGPPMQARAA